MTSSAKASFLRPDLLPALSRFPFALLACALAAAWLLLHTYERSFARGLRIGGEEEVLLALIIAALAAFAAGLALVRAQVWMSLAAQGIALLAALAPLLWRRPDIETLLPLLVAVGCLTALAAGIAARREAEGFWLANARLAASLAVSGVALAITLFGVVIVLYSVETLLGLRMGRIVQTIVILLCTLAFPLLCLSLVRPDGESWDDDFKDNILLRAVSLATDVLLIPIMLAFSTVIHLYAARIAILGDWPKGQIGWLVPLYLIAGYGTFLLAHEPMAKEPIPQEPGGPLSRLRVLFRRLWIPLTLVPIGLLALAVAMRVRAYGLTEERYVLILIAIAGVLFALSILVRRPFEIRLLALVPGILALVAAAGPLSATNMSVRSQTERARAILASVPPERWASAKDGGLSAKQKEDLISAVSYLWRRGYTEMQPLADVWPAHWPKVMWQLSEVLNGRNLRLNPTMEFSYEDDIVSLDTAILLGQFFIRWESTSRLIARGGLSFTVKGQPNGTILEISGEGSTARFDLSPLLIPGASASKGSAFALRSIEGRKAELIVRHLAWRQDSDGPRILSVSAKAVLY